MHDILDQNGDANSMLMLISQQLVIEFSNPDYGTRRLCERNLYYQLEITNHQKTCPHYKDTGNNNSPVVSTNIQHVNQGIGQPSREYDLPNLLKPQYSPDLASDPNHQYCTTGVLSDPFADY